MGIFGRGGRGLTERQSGMLETPGKEIMSLELKILKFKIKLSVRRSKTKKVTSRN